MTLVAPLRARMLRPRLATDAVARPRLLERLLAGMARPLTLISAPAGYGKTTLLCQWLDACPARAAWLSLDRHDSDTASFLIAVIGALQTVWPDAGSDVLGLLRLPTVPPPDYLGAALADALLDLPEPTVLVLDDFQVIADPATYALVAALLEHPPPTLHVALAGRVEPPLPLPRLRARDQVTEVRARDLAFTADETRAFLARAAGVGDDPAAAADLEQGTEGWAAGLRLAALALREAGGAMGVAAAFTGRRQRHALDFLLDEVLTKQSVATEMFLLRTSVVEQVCGPLCEALLEPELQPGEGAATLRQLVAAGLFATALEGSGDGSEWVRYHPLFRELLRERLAEREGAATVAELHRRAVNWFATNGLVDEAIEALLDGGEPDGAAQLVEEQVAAVLDREDWPTLWRWLRRLPENLAARRPGLLLAHAFVDNFRGQWASMTARQAAAMTLLDEGKLTLPPDTVAALRTQADVIGSAICARRGDGAGSVEAARRALAHLPDPESYLGGVARGMVATGLQQLGCYDEALRSLGATDALGGTDAPRLLSALALVELQAGELATARRWAVRLLEASTQRDRPVLVGWAHCLLGRIAYEVDALEEAHAHFAAAAADRGRYNLVTIVESRLGLALTEQAQRRPGGAGWLLGELDETLAETGNDEARPLVNACQACVALQRGDLEEVASWLDERLPEPTDRLTSMEYPSLTRARALLARGAPGDVAAAATLVAAFRARAEQEHATRSLIAALTVQALTERADGDEVAALECLAQAVALAEPGGFVRTFFDLGAPMAALLRTLVTRRPPSAYLDRLLAAFAAEPAAAHRAPAAALAATSAARPAAGPALALASLLTDREAEVLELMGRHLTNKEIAAELSISPMTVKRHVSNVFDKLSVGSRRQAVFQAVAIGLLPPGPR